AHLAAATKRLARLVIHLHGNFRVDEIGRGSDTRIFREDRCDGSFIAKNDEANARMPDQRNISAPDHSRRTMISAHSIQRYRQSPCHQRDPLYMLPSPLSSRSRARPEDTGLIGPDNSCFWPRIAPTQ